MREKKPHSSLEPYIRVFYPEIIGGRSKYGKWYFEVEPRKLCALTAIWYSETPKVKRVTGGYWHPSLDLSQKDQLRFQGENPYSRLELSYLLEEEQEVMEWLLPSLRMAQSSPNFLGAQWSEALKLGEPCNQYLWTHKADEAICSSRARAKKNS